MNSRIKATGGTKFWKFQVLRVYILSHILQIKQKKNSSGRYDQMFGWMNTFLSDILIPILTIKFGILCYFVI